MHVRVHALPRWSSVNLASAKASDRTHQRHAFVARDKPLCDVPLSGNTGLIEAVRTKSPADLGAFVSRIRVYFISDQDDTGPWSQRNFPTRRYIASIHGFNQYLVAEWTGMSSTSADPGGPHSELVSQEWLSENIRVGPLGEHYPDIEFSVEGDTPALLFNVPNGLGDPEHPDWGSWGGRYTSNTLGGSARYGDVVDVAQYFNGQNFLINHASVWRWRDAVQHGFAARMQWTLRPRNANSTKSSFTTAMNVNGSCGSAALLLTAEAGETVTLDASETYSPDDDTHLNFTWCQYYEPSSHQSSPSELPLVNLTGIYGLCGNVVKFTVLVGYEECVRAEDVTESGHRERKSKCPIFHVIVEARDASALHSITRYRRVLPHLQPHERV